MHARPTVLGGDAFTPYGVNAQLGCGLSVKRIQDRPHLYVWAYEPRSWGTRRTWTYAGPMGRPLTRANASRLPLAHHLKVRAEVERRIERLHPLYA